MRKVFSIVLLVVLAITMVPCTALAQNEPVYVAIIWHYHQPWYYSVDEEYFILPWVRMHSVGNYYKMVYILSKYPDVHVTFTFSGSLLVQLKDYVVNKKMDYRQILSWKLARGENLTIDEYFSMLKIPGGFFDINWNRIVNIVPRYASLRDKARQVFSAYADLPEEEFKRRVVKVFTQQDYLDLAVLFNLFWIDPQVLKEQYPDLYELRQKALSDPNIHFSREDLARILSVHEDIMSKIIPLYSELAAKGQIELIPVPYSHPIAPLLVDFGWEEDLSIHVMRGIELFHRLLNYTPIGMWPAEEAVNEPALKVMVERGITWVVTDENLLVLAGIDTTPANLGKPWYIDFSGKKLYVFFRDTDLSNRLGFQYSGLDAESAVNDLVSAILSLGKSGASIVVIALDGENPWEHYPEFGDLFLNKLYEKLSELQSKGLIKTITPGEYLSKFSDKASPLPLRDYDYFDLEGKDISDIDGYDKLPKKTVNAHIAESSWAGLAGRLTPWIGDRQENVAWMWLAIARKTLLDTLNVNSLEEALSINPKAVEALLRAEASDWFWWYGGDMGSPETFDPLFKGYLRQVYKEVNLTPPGYLNATFYPDGFPVGVLDPTPPQPMENPPVIDGKLSSNEWDKYVKAPIGVSYISEAYLGVDPENLYVLFKPVDNSILSDKKLVLAVYLWSPVRSVSPLHLGYNVYPRYGKKDLAIALGYEALIIPYNATSYLSVADGRGGWVRLIDLKVGVGNVVEVAIPWSTIGVEAGSKAYIAIAVFYDEKLVETSTRLKLAYQVRAPRPIIGVGVKTLFDMRDPEGDDNGTGTYVYPTNNVFQLGVFDLVEFKVIDVGDKIVFETYVKNLGDNPWGGPNDFCLQYVQIYVHTTLKEPGNTTTFGLNVAIAPEYAWHFALLLAPGWGADPVPRGERAAIYYANGTVIIQNGDFKIYGDPAKNAIVAEVSKKLLLDVENAENWSYVVVVTSYDGFGPDRIRPFGVSAGEWVIGVGEDLAPAVAVGVIPRIMDLLAPTTEDQYQMLRSFKVDLDTFTGEPAIIKGVSPIAVVKPTATTVMVTETVTETTTITSTVTMAQTLTTALTTLTVTETKEKTIPITQTVTQTETTTTTIVKETTTTWKEYIERIPLHVALGILALAILVFIIILAIVFRLRRF